MSSTERDPIFFPAPADFRAWLKKYHRKESTLWVGYYKKATKKPSVTWQETVDEALCYGWIDGIRKSRDEESYVVRFTPRKPGSVWSRRNIERVEAMRAAGKMRKAGLDAYAYKDAHENSGYVISELPTELPETMSAEFRKHPEAWAFYEAQPAGYRKQTAHWVTSAKQEATRERRLAALMEDSGCGRRMERFR